MAIDGNLVCKYLNEIKKKHGLSNKRWSEISNVPVGTINRYMSYNVGVPSFMHVCAMLESVNEPLSDFYAAVNVAIEKAAPVTVPPSGVVDVAAVVQIAPPDPTAVASMQEAISLQSEVLVGQVGQVIEKDAQLLGLQSDVDALKKELENVRIENARLATELVQNKKQKRILRNILLVLAALEVLLANYGFVRGLF